MDLRDRDVVWARGIIGDFVSISVKEGQSAHVEPVHLCPLGQSPLPHVTPELVQEAAEAGSLVGLLPPAGK